MKNKNMTALVSCFARSYHKKNNEVKIFDDYFAEKILSDDEYNSISSNMTNGINYFNPNFKGTNEEALRWIVDNQLSPSPLGRSTYTEKMLQNAIMIGAKQYLIFAAGYDTYAYRQNNYNSDFQIFEIDQSFMIDDKINRINKLNIEISNVNYIKCDFTDKNWEKEITKNNNYDMNKISFCSVLGISYYLSRDNFKKMIKKISIIIPYGSTLVFDYPSISNSEQTIKQEELAKEAQEEMKAKYSYNDIEEILSDNDFLIYEHLTPDEITEQYFKEYNNANQNSQMKAFDSVNYCLAVKKTTYQ